MLAPTSRTLQVDDRRLYLEEWGRGTPLVIIPPGNGDASPFRALANQLMSQFRVIAFDRAGYSRSHPTDTTQGVEQDASDAIAILRDTGSAGGVVGGSSAGVVALECATRNDSFVRFSIAHEAPMVDFTEEPDRWVAFYQKVYSEYRRNGTSQAYRLFREGMELGRHTKPNPEHELPPRELDRLLERVRDNRYRWFEHELPTYPRHKIDPHKLASSTSEVILAGGADGAPMPREATRSLADRLNKPLHLLPGGHVPYITHVEEFARWLTAVVAKVRP